jgi:hypothetical protein
VVYAGTDAGVHRTCDGGLDWELFGEGLPNVPVMDLVVDSVFHRLAAGTLGRGVWSVPLTGHSDADENGRVDMIDFLALQLCMSGPAGDPGFVQPSPACISDFSCDCDEDVDVVDYACLHSRLAGP